MIIKSQHEKRQLPVEFFVLAELLHLFKSFVARTLLVQIALSQAEPVELIVLTQLLALPQSLPLRDVVRERLD